MGVRDFMTSTDQGALDLLGAESRKSYEDIGWLSFAIGYERPVKNRKTGEYAVMKSGKIIRREK